MSSNKAQTVIILALEISSDVIKNNVKAGKLIDVDGAIEAMLYHKQLIADIKANKVIIQVLNT